MKTPNSVTNLGKAIRRYAAGGTDDIRLARAMADVIVGQMLPDGVVKGGSSLMFRYGGRQTRYTRDVDTARTEDLQSYLKELRDNLEAGWHGFSGKLIDVQPPSPANVPKPYVMIPFDVKLRYLGRPWLAVRIEIGHNEIGDADRFDTELPDDVAKAFVALGFPEPRPIRVMTLPFQVAQKLHALSSEGSDRAHDLVDLQLIRHHSNLPMPEIKSICERLFAYRREQSWPPRIVAGPRWADIYAASRESVPDPSFLLPTVEEAVRWVNEFLSDIQNETE